MIQLTRSTGLETGDVLALRARGGAANDGRAMGSFIDECVSALPDGARDRYRLWIRVDSAGYQAQVIEAAQRHGADFTVTAKGNTKVAGLVHALAADPDTCWAPAEGNETDAGSEIAETTATLLGRTLRLIVRRQPKAAGKQLAFDDVDGWRLHTIITNIDAEQMSAAAVEAHHRLRGGIPEDTIRSLKTDYGMIHAPVGPFFGNWLYWQAAALAHNVGLWLRTLALPERSDGAVANGCGWPSSTCPPASSATAGHCGCASAPPTRTSTRSPPRLPGLKPCPPSAEHARPPTAPTRTPPRR